MRPEQPPKRIFLQRDDDDNADWDGASWCEDPINDGDVEYIRADLARPTPSLAAGPDLEEAWKATRIEESGVQPVMKAALREVFTNGWNARAALPSPAAPLGALDRIEDKFQALCDRYCDLTVGGHLPECSEAAEDMGIIRAALSPSSVAHSPDAEKVKCDSCMSERDPACPACAGAGWFWAPSEGKEKGPGEVEEAYKAGFHAGERYAENHGEEDDVDEAWTSYKIHFGEKGTEEGK